MPVDDVGRGVSVELVADVDELLHGGDIDVVDRGEVEDDGLEGRKIDVHTGSTFAESSGFGGLALLLGRARVVPGPVSGTLKGCEVGAAGVLEDIFGEVVERVVGVGVVEALGEAVDEDTWVGVLELVPGLVPSL